MKFLYFIPALILLLSISCSLFIEDKKIVRSSEHEEKNISRTIASSESFVCFDSPDLQFDQLGDFIHQVEVSRTLNKKLASNIYKKSKIFLDTLNKMIEKNRNRSLSINEQITNAYWWGLKFQKRVNKQLKRAKHRKINIFKKSDSLLNTAYAKAIITLEILTHWHAVKKVDPSDFKTRIGLLSKIFSLSSDQQISKNNRENLIIYAFYQMKSPEILKSIIQDDDLTGAKHGRIQKYDILFKQYQKLYDNFLERLNSFSVFKREMAYIVSYLKDISSFPKHAKHIVTNIKSYKSFDQRYSSIIQRLENRIEFDPEKDLPPIKCKYTFLISLYYAAIYPMHINFHDVFDSTIYHLRNLESTSDGFLLYSTAREKYLIFLNNLEETLKQKTSKKSPVNSQSLYEKIESVQHLRLNFINKLLYMTYKNKGVKFKKLEERIQNHIKNSQDEFASNVTSLSEFKIKDFLLKSIKKINYLKDSNDLNQKLVKLFISKGHHNFKCPFKLRPSLDKNNEDSYCLEKALEKIILSEEHELDVENKIAWLHVLRLLDIVFLEGNQLQNVPIVKNDWIYYTHRLRQILNKRRINKSYRGITENQIKKALKPQTSKYHNSKADQAFRTYYQYNQTNIYLYADKDIEVSLDNKSITPINANYPQTKVYLLNRKTLPDSKNKLDKKRLSFRATSENKNVDFNIDYTVIRKMPDFKKFKPNLAYWGKDNIYKIMAISSPGYGQVEKWFDWVLERKYNFSKKVVGIVKYSKAENSLRSTETLVIEAHINRSCLCPTGKNYKKIIYEKNHFNRKVLVTLYDPTTDPKKKVIDKCRKRKYFFRNLSEGSLLVEGRCFSSKCVSLNYQVCSPSQQICTACSAVTQEETTDFVAVLSQVFLENYDLRRITWEDVYNRLSSSSQRILRMPNQDLTKYDFDLKHLIHSNISGIVEQPLWLKYLQFPTIFEPGHSPELWLNYSPDFKKVTNILEILYAQEDWFTFLSHHPTLRNRWFEKNILEINPDNLSDDIRSLLMLYYYTAMNNENFTIRYNAVKTIGKISSANEALPLLSIALNDKDIAIKALAIRLLAKHGEKSIPILINKLNDSSSEVRHEAGESLIKIGPDTVPALIKALSQAGDTKMISIIFILEGIGPKANKACSELMKIFNKNMQAIHEHVIRAFGKINCMPTKIIPILVEILLDENNNYGLRSSAALGLSYYGEKAASALINVLKDPSSSEKDIKFVAYAIDYMDLAIPNAIPILLKVINKIQHYEVRYAVMNAIITTCKKSKTTALKLVPFFIDSFNKGNLRGDIYDKIENIIVDLGKKAVPYLIKAMKKKSYKEKRKIAWILGRIGPNAKDALPILRKTLTDSDPYVRMRARQAIKKIEGKR